MLRRLQYYFVLVFVSVVLHSECSSGWNAIESQCYSATHTSDWSSLTWEKARQTCIDAGADLPVIDTAAEFNALYELTKGLNNNAWLRCSSPSWDTFDCEDHSAFFNSKEDFSGYWPWKTGQPSSKASSQCLVLNVVDEVDTGVLTSAECTSMLSSTYLCEKAPTNTQTATVVPQKVITTDPVSEAQSPTITTTDVPSTPGQTQPETTQAATTEGTTETHPTTFRVIMHTETTPVVTTEGVPTEEVTTEGVTTEGATTTETSYPFVKNTSPVTTTVPQILDQTKAEPSSGLTTRGETETPTVVPLSTTLTGRNPVVTTQVEAIDPRSETVTVPSSPPNEESGTCYVIMEPDPQADNRVRWLVPQPDPCLCKRIRLGGINTRATARQYPVKFVDTVVIGRDPVEIGNWLGCEPYLNESPAIYY